MQGGGVSDEEPCRECGGQSVLFQGTGAETQFRICTRWRKPGHLSEREIKDRIRDERAKAFPSSGRFA